MLLVDCEGARSWCKPEQIREQEKWIFCANGTVISLPAGWNGQSEVPLNIGCSGTFPFGLCVSFAFQPVGPKILAKWKVPLGFPLALARIT